GRRCADEVRRRRDLTPLNGEQNPAAVSGETRQPAPESRSGQARSLGERLDALTRGAAARPRREHQAVDADRLVALDDPAVVSRTPSGQQRDLEALPAGLGSPPLEVVDDRLGRLRRRAAAEPAVADLDTTSEG